MKIRSIFLSITVILYLLFFLSSFPGLILLKALVCGIILFILPGFCLTSALTRGRYNASLSLVINLFISTFICISGLALFRLLPGPITLNGFLLFLFIITVSGTLLLTRDNIITLRTQRTAFLATTLILLCVNSFNMPHIIDQDLHFTAPAYGCVHTLKPYTSLSRVPFLFDHSQLPTFMSAVSIFTMGDLEKTRHFYSRAKEIEDKYPEEMIQSLWHSFPFSSESKQEKWLLGEKNVKFSARIPHFFMGAFCLLMIMEIVQKQTGSLGAGIFASVLTLSPGLLVRFSSGGWTASILLTLLSVTYIYLYEKDKRLLFFFGAAGGLINQKTVIAVLAIFFTDIYRKKIRNMFYVLSGWITGILLVSLYGFILNWNCFLHAFFMDHGVTGLLSGTDNIPGFFASWSRTLLYMNPLLFFFGIAAVIYYTCRKTRSSFWIIPAWFWSGSLLFVLSRWPNARNAALAYPAIQICIVSMIWELKNIRLKNILICSISVVYFINILLMSGTFLYPNSFYALNEDGKTPSDVVREYRDKVLKPGA